MFKCWKLPQKLHEWRGIVRSSLASQHLAVPLDEAEVEEEFLAAAGFEHSSKPAQIITNPSEQAKEMTQMTQALPLLLPHPPRCGRNMLEADEERVFKAKSTPFTGY